MNKKLKYFSIGLVAGAVFSEDLRALGKGFLFRSADAVGTGLGAFIVGPESRERGRRAS